MGIAQSEYTEEQILNYFPQPTDPNAKPLTTMADFKRYDNMKAIQVHGTDGRGYNDMICAVFVQSQMSAGAPSDTSSCGQGYVYNPKEESVSEPEPVAEEVVDPVVITNVVKQNDSFKFRWVYLVAPVLVASCILGFLFCRRKSSPTLDGYTAALNDEL